MERLALVLLCLGLMAAPVAAQSQNSGNPGFVSPNSPLYGLEVAWDNAAVSVGLKKASKVAEERVSEAESMAEKNNTRGMQKAAEEFGKMSEKAINRNETGMEDKIERMENVISKAPNQQAREGMEKALENMRRAKQKKLEARRNRSVPDEQIPTEPDGGIGDTPDDERPPFESPSNQNDSDEVENPGEDTTERTSGEGDFELMVSDAPADISDFDYLNVSFSEARIFPASSEEDGNETEEEETNETDSGNSTDMMNQTDEDDSIENESENEGFRVVQLNDSNVDLTTVVGEYAQSVANTSLEAGEYSKIELYSSDISASVNGSDVNVKIPPGKLMITKPFTVSANESTEFVFDIQVALRGNERNNQGYILKPVISESGVAGKDVEMKRGKSKVDDGRDRGQSESGNQNNSSDSNRGGPQGGPSSGPGL